jgi:quinol monooxygenase YgiN
MTLVEAWKDRKAIEAQSAAAHMIVFRDKLAPLMGALLDERFYKAIN